MGESGEVMTYAELDAGANRLSRLLYAAGLRPGDHVALCLENHPRYFEVVWGCIYAGLVYTACSSRLTSSELAYIINDCGARVFITSRYKADQAAEVVPETPEVEVRLMLDGVIEGYQPYEDAVARQPADPLSDRIAGTDMLYSSGTTGRPKGVKSKAPSTPLGSELTSVAGLQAVLFGADADMVYLSPAPLYHAAPLRFSLATHELGGTVVAMEHFDPEQALVLIERYRATHSQWVPTMFVRMLKLPAEVRQRYDLSSLRIAVHAAAPCPVDMKRQMIEWWGPVLHEYYAGTEGNGFIYCNSEMWLAHPGTVGTPLGCIVHIVGEDGRGVAAGRGGHGLLRGRAHLRVPQRPGQDGGLPPCEGMVHAGRRRVPRRRRLPLPHRPQGVHDHLGRGEHLPAGGRERPHQPPGRGGRGRVRGAQRGLRRGGEGRRAAHHHAGRRRRRGDAGAQLIAYCRTELADVKCPRSIDFREELPRHPTGKLYKRLLKDEYWAGHGGRSI